MSDVNYSALNDVSGHIWKKYKKAEKKYEKMDNEIFGIITEGHSGELKLIFDTVINSDIGDEHHRRLAKNIWERYDITGKISASDLLLINGWYSIIISTQVSKLINEDTNLEDSLNNENEVKERE